jgi:hypothetical protein
LQALPLDSSETRGWPGWGARQPFFLVAQISVCGVWALQIRTSTD